MRPLRSELSPQNVNVVAGNWLDDLRRLFVQSDWDTNTNFAMTVKRWA